MAWKRYFVFVLTVSLLLAGCSARSKSSGLYENSVSPSTGSAVGGSTGSTAGGGALAKSESALNDSKPNSQMGLTSPEQTSAAQDGSKKIKTANIIMETLKFDESTAGIDKLISQSGGYIQNSSTTGTGALYKNSYYTRKATYTIRVPADQLEGFNAALSQYGSITSTNVSSQEVTDYYYDTDAHLTSLKQQEQQLLEILNKAQKLEDVISLQKALADVRYQIESNQGVLRRLDSQIAYSTIQLNLSEVQEISNIQGVPKSLGERISAQFSSSIRSIKSFGENALVFLIGNSMQIILVLAIVAGVFFISRHNGKWRKDVKKQEDKKPDLPPKEDEE